MYTFFKIYNVLIYECPVLFRQITSIDILLVSSEREETDVHANTTSLQQAIQRTVSESSDVESTQVELVSIMSFVLLGLHI